MIYVWRWEAYGKTYAVLDLGDDGVLAQEVHEAARGQV